MVKELEKLAGIPGHDVPFLIVAGRALTPRQAYDAWLKGGKAREEVERALRARGIDSPSNEEIRQLALAHYVDLARRFPNIKVVVPIWGQPRAMTYADMVNHLMKKDDVAVAICEAYKLRLAEMQRIATG